MKLRTIALALSLALAGTQAHAATSQAPMSNCEKMGDQVYATITIKDGTILRTPIEDKRLNFDVDKRSLRLDMSQLQSITGLHTNEHYTVATLTNIAGTTFRAKMSYVYMETYAHYMDAMTMDRVCLKIPAKDILSVTFGEYTERHGGPVMMNERTMDFFPPFYLFDPYTGEHLVPGRPGVRGQ